MSVIVVGAGPAGATAARTLARAGVTVRLLDRSKFPRNKPCGGGISLRVLRRFPYLEPALSRIATHVVSRLHLEGPDGHSALVESDAPAALLIRRVEFDNLLVELAVEAGAELVGDAEVVQARETANGLDLQTRDGRRFEAPLVIAADGVHSVLAKRLGLNAGWTKGAIALDMMEETPRSVLRDLDPSTMWVAYGYDAGGKQAHRGRRAAEGYAYVFPKRDHVNVGIGYVLDHYRREIDEAPYTLQSGFVEMLRKRHVVEGESDRRNFTPFLIPVGGPLRRPGRGRVLLAGDAGGFVNGFTAEGIYYAMVSGDLAARSIAASDRYRPAGIAARYNRLVNGEIGPELRDSVLLRNYLFADRRRIATVIGGAGRDAAMTRLIVDYAIGRMPYGALRRRVLTRAPLMAGQLIREWLREKLFRYRPIAVRI
jgi:geranylgeranyl reductase family protein